MHPVVQPLAVELPQGVQRYRKGREIGKSLFGTVRYGCDVVTNQWVVIKESDIEKVSEKISTKGVSVAEDLNMEIELLRRLSEVENPCPYLVRFLDVCQDATFIYVVLEYIECGDLFGHVQTHIAQILNIRDPQIKKQQLQRYQKNIRKWIKQVLLCLKFMHDRNICHRDVSLENTMLSKDANAKLIDLGVAHYYPDGNFSTEHGAIGKMQYCSPECLKNEYYDGRANDIWCVGVMLWMSLIGAPPWDSAAISDARYCFIMGGTSGVMGLVTRWGRRWMCPDSAADLLSKIFRPQKDRIRMEQALTHPFLTGRNERVVDNYIPVPLRKHLPDVVLGQRWQLFLDSGISLASKPNIFKRLSPSILDKIQKFISKGDLFVGGIFDQRITNEMCYSCQLHMDAVHEVIIYYMAASRGLLKLHEESQKLQKSGKLPVSRGYNVDEEKIVQPSWFIKFKEIKRWNLLQTFGDWKQRGGLQTPKGKEKFLEDLEQQFGLNRVQCDELWKYLEESGKLGNQSGQNSSQYPEQLRKVILRELKTKFKLGDAICQEICAYFAKRKKQEKKPAGGTQDISHRKDKLVKELNNKFSLGETKCGEIVDHFIKNGYVRIGHSLRSDN